MADQKKVTPKAKAANKAATKTQQTETVANSSLTNLRQPTAEEVKAIFNPQARFEAIGVKETKEVLVFSVASIEAFRAAKANNGKIDAADLPLLFDPATKLLPAINGANLIGKELADLSPTEIEEIVSLVGPSILNPRYRRVFIATLEFGSSIADLFDDETEA